MIDAWNLLFRSPRIFRFLFKFVQPTPLLESTRSDSDRVGIFLSLERWINSRSISCDVCYFTVLRKKYLKKEKRNIFPLLSALKFYKIISIIRANEREIYFIGEDY